MKRREIYEAVLEAFESKFSWLGLQFAQAFLSSISSFNIQTYSKPEFRARQHLMLCWPPGWFKTALLLLAQKLLGYPLCGIMSDISNAALRGTVEGNNFVPPEVLKTPFSVCTDFGQVSLTGYDTELTQKLLNLLEEGEVKVSLAKIAYITDEKRAEIENNWGVEFPDRSSFRYSTNWILMAATYNKKFLVDNALVSRFNIMYPNQKLDNALVKHVVNAPPFHVEEEVKLALRKELLSNIPIETKVKLPDEVYDGLPITGRDSGFLQSQILCRSWWNLKTTKDDILQLAERMHKSRNEIWASIGDRVFDCIRLKAKAIPEIAEELEISERHVYNGIAELRKKGIVNKQLAYDEESNQIIKWRGG